MRGKTAIVAGVLGMVLLAGAEIASAQLKLVYEGSFKMPSSSGWGDYYYGALAFVPNGTPRPAWGGAPVTGPSLIAFTAWGPHTIEVNQLPAFSKTVGGMGTAVWLANTSGGTYYGSGNTPTFVDAAGNLWANWFDGAGFPAIYRKPGIAVLGSNQPPNVVDTGWPSGPGGSNYRNGAALRRGDGAGGDLTANGMDTGARFITCANLAGGGAGYGVYVAESVRTSSTTVTGNVLFAAYQTDNLQGRRPVTYVRDVTKEHEWFVMWRGDSRSGDSFKLDFFASSTRGNADPTVKYDIGPDIKNGAGWLNGSSQIKCVTVDWDNSQLYVLDGYVRDAWIHVFTVKSLPAIQNVAATDILDNSANLVGYLPAQTADVVCYWGTGDGGTNAASWATNTPMGSLTGPLTFTNSLTGLANGTIYFFRYWAANSVGAAWATNTLQFATTGADPAPQVDNDGGPVSITTTEARMQGEVLAGVPDPQVWIYWGTTDGTDNKASWNQPPVDKGTMGISSFFQDLTGLLANQQYWYRCYASNSVTDAWSPASSNFTTLAPTLAIGNASVTEGASTATLSFTVTLSATSAVAVTVNYATTDGTATLADSDYVQTNGTLTIPAGSVSGQIAVTVVGNNVYELDETVLLDLSGAVNATITTSQGVGTIVNDDWTWYVRCDGLGSDTNNGCSWARAFASVSNALWQVPVSASPAPASVINIQATTGAQAYDAASRNVTGSGYNGHLNISFDGGWTDVDGTPLQTGRSLIKDLDGTVDERGLDLYSSDDHGRAKIISVNRLDFADVTDGIRLFCTPNLEYGTVLSLTLRNCSIAANSNGLVLSHSLGDRIPLICSNVTIRAGLGGLAGDGIYYEYQVSSLSFDTTTITSAKGRGINVKGVCGGGWLNSYTLTMRDSNVTNCFADGIYLGEDTFGHYSTPGLVYLDRVRIVGNGGRGLYARFDNGNGDVPYYLYATNVVVAGNAGHGIFLDGLDNLDSADSIWGARMYATLVNATIAQNGGDGLLIHGEPASGNSGVTIFNTIFAANGGAAVDVVDYTNGVPTAVEGYNDFYGNSGDSIVLVGSSLTVTNYPALAASDLTVDPLFVAKQPDPYRLTMHSPLLDAGTNARAPAVDIMLVTRPAGAAVSMGAYETGISASTGTAIFLR